MDTTSDNAAESESNQNEAESTERSRSFLVGLAMNMGRAARLVTDGFGLVGIEGKRQYRRIQQ